MNSTKLLSDYLDQASPIDTATFDLRFEEAVSLLEQDAFEDAIPLIEEVFKEGCLDIRLIMQLFYALFLKEGVMSLAKTLPSLQEVLTTYWEKLSPISMRESHASKSIVWFFSTLSKRMKRSGELHKEKRIDSLWSRTATCSSEDLNTIERLLEDLITFFLNTWKLPVCQQHIRSILSWIGSVKKTLSNPLPSSKPPNPSPKKAPPPSKTKEALPTKQTGKTPASSSFISPNLEKLTQKLHLFEALIKENKFKKASLVASDIQQIIENFDPILFFPELFSSYLSILAKHIDTLTMEWDQKESPQWNALNQLYQTDIEAFVKW